MYVYVVLAKIFSHLHLQNPISHGKPQLLFEIRKNKEVIQRN